MTNPSSDFDHSERFRVVGRDGRVDLTKYTVQIHGRDIIDYERLKADNPMLYKEIVAGELETDRKQQEEYEELEKEFSKRPSTPLESIQSSMTIGKPATAKYFYLPLFVLNLRQNQAEEKREVDLLVFSDDLGRPMVYASRVLPGQTLAEAVKGDLYKDFDYKGKFQIISHYFYDTTKDKHGTPLPRLAVLIGVDQFTTETLRPAGLSVHWSADGLEHLREYSFDVV